MAIVTEGDRILVIDKRLFKDDNTRLFVGIVEEFAMNVIRARGFSYHVSPYEVSGAERRGEERVRVITLASGDIIFVLPRDQDLTRLQSVIGWVATGVMFAVAACMIATLI